MQPSGTIVGRDGSRLRSDSLGPDLHMQLTLLTVPILGLVAKKDKGTRGTRHESPLWLQGLSSS